MNKKGIVIFALLGVLFGWLLIGTCIKNYQGPVECMGEICE